MAYTQDGRLIAIYTPLGKDVLLLQKIEGTEAVSRLFNFQLDLRSEDDKIDPANIIGKAVTVSLTLADGSQRFVNGYVSRFTQGRRDLRLAHYRAEMVPWLWFLTRRSDCRIFQNETVPEIIEQVFSALQFTDFKNNVEGDEPKLEYCVQYRETDFDFVSRLMEQRGIFYFFKHEKEKHTLVLANSPATVAECPGQSKVRFEDRTGALYEDEELITIWQADRELRPGGYGLADFNFTTPTTNLTVSVDSTINVGGNSGYQVFDYPGAYLTKSQGDDVAKIRMQEEEAAHFVASGESNCRALVSGYRFTLDEHHVRSMNVAYLLTEVRHQASAGAYFTAGEEGEGEARYANQFTCIPYSVPYRPPRVTPKPQVKGVQTAIVVGPSGEEIYTDKYGRVKVQFHWDRRGKYDENSSCWVRVAQDWAGKRWGALFLPRLGQEVIVDFLEGDPDQPIIVGSVYNALEMPPYPLPDEKTKSTVKSYSSKGGGGFNEIRFEDKKGSEQLFIQAERNQDNRVKKDALEWVGNNRHLIVKTDQYEEVDGDKHLTVKGDQNEKVDGTVSLKTGMDLQQKVGMKHALDAGMEIHLKGGMNVVIEAGVGITLKVGGNFITINPAGIQIVGQPLLMLNSGGSALEGSGCSPEKPTAPQEADKAEPGEMGEPPPPASVPSPAARSPQALALTEAAKSGAPFCEKCAEAARAEALAAGATPEQAEEAAEEAGIAGAAAEAEEPAAPVMEKGKTFVAIELHDQKGRPMRGERYQIKLPDGTVKEGKLDDDGKARIDGIDPGSCKITFPDIDGREWKPA